jgi:hypothetical protein
MRIEIKTLTNKSHFIAATSNSKIIDVKETILNCTNIPVGEQRLCFAGKQLEDHYTLDDYGIKDCDIVFLVLRLFGGMHNAASARSGGYDMHIFICTKFCDRIYLQVRKTDTIEEIKIMLRDDPVIKKITNGFQNPSRYDLYFEFTKMEPDKTLEFYNVVDCANIRISNLL